MVDIAAGDLGARPRKFDCEAWIPSQGTYRELTSTSNCTDLQARRIGCRVGRPTARPPLHTLNGTAVAVGRTIVALLENHQQPDGGFTLPNILHRYGSPERVSPR